MKQKNIALVIAGFIIGIMICFIKQVDNELSNFTIFDEDDLQ